MEVKVEVEYVVVVVIVGGYLPVGSKRGGSDSPTYVQYIFRGRKSLWAGADGHPIIGDRCALALRRPTRWV